MWPSDQQGKHEEAQRPAGVLQAETGGSSREVAVVAVTEVGL